VVNTGVAAPGTITIGAPGALVTIATANAMTIGNNYTPNVGFSRSAMQLITRTPQMPIGPDGKAMDMADDVIMDITDPVSGITFPDRRVPAVHAAVLPRAPCLGRSGDQAEPHRDAARLSERGKGAGWGMDAPAPLTVFQMRRYWNG
jgi:hypothetical protein